MGLESDFSASQFRHQHPKLPDLAPNLPHQTTTANYLFPFRKALQPTASGKKRYDTLSPSSSFHLSSPPPPPPAPLPLVNRRKCSRARSSVPPGPLPSPSAPPPRSACPPGPTPPLLLPTSRPPRPSSVLTVPMLLLWYAFSPVDFVFLSLVLGILVFWQGSFGWIGIVGP